MLSDEIEKTRPEACNLLGIYAALASKPIADVLTEFEGQAFSHFKQVLTDLAVAELGPEAVQRPQPARSALTHLIEAEIFGFLPAWNHLRKEGATQGLAAEAMA